MTPVTAAAPIAVTIQPSAISHQRTHHKVCPHGPRVVEGAQDADAFMEEALSRVEVQYESLFYGVDLKQYGRADYDQLLANVADLPASERRRLMLAGLNELVASIQLGVKEHHGTQEEAVVSGIIKEAYRRLGVP